MKTVKSVRINDTVVELRREEPVSSFGKSYIYIEAPSEYDEDGKVKKVSSVLLDTEYAFDVYNSLKLILGLK